MLTYASRSGAARDDALQQRALLQHQVLKLLVSVRGLKLLMYEALISYNISCSAVAADVEAGQDVC